MDPTFYWHDYETWGTRPATDRPSQFAGVRTDIDLNIIDEPLVLYCKPPQDCLPQPMACLVTGITPQEADKKGVVESAFIARILKEFATPNTCSVGYNSLRFDDEVTRYTLYRNFYDPYEREWRNGNSRWDIIDMVRCCYALKPGGIEWPTVQGKPSFKLESLTRANNIEHGAAHDAYSDVAATIALAKLIKEKQPDLYRHIFSIKDKKTAGALIDLKSQRPLLHISSKFASQNGCAGLIAPIAMHPVNKNAVIVAVLDKDPTVLEHLSAEEIKEKLYTPTHELKNDEQRLGLKCIHLNKCPILLTPKLLTRENEVRLGLDKTACEEHWRKLRSMNIAAKIQDAFAQTAFEKSQDPEQQLYDGFIHNTDKSVMQDVRAASAKSLLENRFVFSDTRLNKMLPLYLARNFPQSIDGPILEEWVVHKAQRLRDGKDGFLSLDTFNMHVEALLIEHKDDPKKRSILEALQEYSLQKSAEISGEI